MDTQSDAPLIVAEKLGKMYPLYAKPSDRLKQAFMWGRRQYFREFWALRDVSFTIRAGEVVGVIGRNGSGKSTLLQLLAGVLRPTCGIGQVHGRVAALLELGSGFNPEFTGRENLFMNAAILGLSQRQIEQRYDQIVAFAEIGPFIDQPVKTYSSGMVMRLAFAVAVHVDAQILVVDEALAVGDAAFQFKCLHHLETLLERGVTILLVSHDNQLVKSYCTRAIYLKQGRIAFDGDCETATEMFLMEMRQSQLAAAPVAQKPADAGQLRFGSARGRILDCQMGVVGQTEPRRDVASGRRMWVRVQAHVAEDVARPRLSLLVRDLKGYNLFAYNNVSAQVPLTPDRGGNIAGRFEFDARLKPGDYAVALRLENYVSPTANELLDKHVSAMAFKVLADQVRFEGSVDLNGSFYAAAPLSDAAGQPAAAPGASSAAQQPPPSSAAKLVSIPTQAPQSVLMITLDSCRHDSFMQAKLPNMRALGEVYKAQAPGNFTYSSHAAMFVGFTPGDPTQKRGLINPKYGKIFKLAGRGHGAKGTEHFVLHGRNIIDGFHRRGYHTLGSGAVGWFDPQTETAQALISDFDEFFYPGDTWSLPRQIDWLAARLQSPRPVFAFLNIGEPHVPYYFQGAPWANTDNPCVPFGDNDAAECRRRQIACLEFVDGQLAPLLEAFAASSTVICGDHGDCWGEEGLWEHGITHPAVLEVPLLFRLGPSQ